MLRPMPRLAPVMSAMRVMALHGAAGDGALPETASSRDEPSLDTRFAGPDTGVVMDRDGLADFLRRRREALRPSDVGLPEGARRRTAGLRREEVAALASMSSDFYTRLEQRRGSRPSPSMVASIARALRLTQDERDHLFRLAGHLAPPRGHRSGHVSPALMRVLDRLDTPAQVTDDLGTVLRQNPLAEALLGEQAGQNVIERWFTDAAARERWPSEDHDTVSRSYVAHLRAVVRDDDPEARALVERLRASAEFAACGNATRSRPGPTPASASGTRSWAS